jgi:hypothetical protein
MISYVKYPNTPQSDAMDRVLHVVETIENGKVEVMATDPMNAIEIVSGLNFNYPINRALLKKLRKVQND